MRAVRRIVVVGGGLAGRVTGVVGFSAPRQVMRMRPLLAEPTGYDDAMAAAAEGAIRVPDSA